MLKHCFFLFIKNEYYSVQASKFFYLLRSKGQNFFPQLWVARLFILYTKTARPPSPSAELIDCPQNKPGINEPSYEMVGVKITVTNYGQSKSYFWHFFSCWFFIFFSDNSKCFHRNGFEMYILIIIYTVCTCDTLVPTRILDSEISWFCFDFPKWSPVSFIITDFNVFVQFFE